MDEGLREVILTIAGVSADMRQDFPGKRGAAGSKNVYGETQQKLDVWADGILTKKLLETGRVKAVLSEERAEATMGDGRYIVSMDPLDGSSNIKSNNIFGTIIGIYDGGELLQPGRNLRAAFYVMYGPLTSIVMATEKGVSEYDYNERAGRFVMTKEDIRLPEPGKLYAPGGRNAGWSQELVDFTDSLFERKLKLRYGGAFVGDINQVLSYGGIFYYPANKKKPEGKLRLVIECNPMAFIMAKAGGAASDGKQDILSIRPKEIAHRTPIFIGSSELVKAAEKMVD